MFFIFCVQKKINQIFVIVKLKKTRAVFVREKKGVKVRPQRNDVEKKH